MNLDMGENEVVSAASFLGERVKKKKKPRAKSVGPKLFEKAWREMLVMKGSGDWSEATGRHFVALYEFFHERVYGTAPLEMDGPARFYASSIAAGFLKRWFDDQPGEMARFMAWVWDRENSNKQSTRRIGYRLQFSPNLITDYRSAMHRIRIGAVSRPQYRQGDE